MKRRYQTFDNQDLSTTSSVAEPPSNSSSAGEENVFFENPTFVHDIEAQLPPSSGQTESSTRETSSTSSSSSRSNSKDNRKNGSSSPKKDAGLRAGAKDERNEQDCSLPATERSALQNQSRSDSNATSELSAFFNLLKSNIGTGMLALPQAFYYAGLWLALVVTPLIGVIATHCMHLLLQSSRLLCVRMNVESLNYEESMNAAFRTGPERLRPLATFMTLATKTFICVTQIGFCCVYYEFVSENLYQVFECNEATRSGMSLVDYKLILFLPFIIICTATELKVIGYMSITSCSLFVATVAIILYYCTRDLVQYPATALPGVGDWDTLPLYFGTVVFAIEGIGCMLPIENRMADPSNFHGVVGVLNTCMVIVICLYTGIGFFGYLRYGSEVEGAITLNLPSDEIVAQSAKLIVSLAVFLSYPIQLYVVAQLFTTLWSRDSDSRTRRLFKNYVVRAACVVFTLITALALPDVGLFISLVGAVSGAMMCLILPPIVHLVAVWPERRPSAFVIGKAIFIVCFGMLGSVVGTVTSISAIIDFFSQYDGSTPLQCSEL